MATTTTSPPCNNKEKEPPTANNKAAVEAQDGNDGGDAAQAARVSQLLKQIIEPSLISSQQDEERQRSYHDRLRSYSPLTHFAKPPSLSPLICSLFGWRNVSPNMLTCDECQQALALIFLPTLSGVAHCKLTCFYEDRLSASHKETCSYREPAASYVKSARDNANAASSERSNAAKSLENDIVPSAAAASITEPLVPTLLESLFTKEDLQLMDHAYPVRPFFNLVQSFQSILQNKHHHQLQLPKLETPKSLLFYDPSRKPGDNLPDQTLLQRLVDLLLTTERTGEDDDTTITSVMRVQSPAHVESLVALVLLGWRPPSAAAAAAAAAVSGSDDSSSSNSRVVFSASCPLCLASISIELVPASGGSGDTRSQREKQQQQQTHPLNKNKRHRRNPSSPCNPVIGHKHYCPHITGFPINGASGAKPLWESISDRLLSRQPNEGGSLENQGADSGETTSSTQPGAWERIHKMLVSGIALNKDSIA